jgi:hypothetical protein
MNYQFVDPVISHSLQSTEHFLFSSLDSSSQTVRDFWDDSMKFNIGQNGFCFIHNLSSGERIAISFISQDTDIMTKKSLAFNCSDLEVLCYFSGEAFVKILGTQREMIDALSKAELLFLHKLVRHDDPERALKRLPGFSGNKSLQVSISKKLGVQNILQAIALANWHGWFDNVPYDREDVEVLIGGLG